MSTPTHTRTQVRDDARTQVKDWLAEAQATGTMNHYAGKHRHPRFTWTVPLEVCVSTKSTHAKSHYATSIDICEGGLGFFCRTPISDFTSIEILVDGEDVGVSAVVMYCMQSLGGYRIGVEFRFDQNAQSASSLRRAG